MDKKVIRNDIILIGSLLLVAVIALVLVLSFSVKKNLVATIKVQDQVVETIDLNKNNDKHYYVDGVNGQMHVHVLDGAIAVLESTCPHKDCIKMGYVSETNHPIICAYNQVYIVIEGNESLNDLDV